jgi:methylthioribose-1-phosphate isomerase
VCSDLTAAKQLLDDSRPTAVNLSWATSRIMELAVALSVAGISIDKFRETLLHEAQELADDDVRINKRLGDFGAALIKPGSNLVHHCNTGYERAQRAWERKHRRVSPRWASAVS